MRPRTFYLSAVLPFVWFAGTVEILRLWVGRIPADRPLTSLEDILVEASLFGVRAMPFAVLAGALAAPPLTLIAGYFVRAAQAGQSWVKEALIWIGVFFSSLGIIAALLASDRAIPLALPLLWSFSAAYALVVATSYRAQLALVAEGRSRIPGGLLLWAGTIFFFWGLLVGIIPLLAGRGSREVQGVVEQGNEADEARWWMLARLVYRHRCALRS